MSERTCQGPMLRFEGKLLVWSKRMNPSKWSLHLQSHGETRCQMNEEIKNARGHAHIHTHHHVTHTYLERKDLLESAHSQQTTLLQTRQCTFQSSRQLRVGTQIQRRYQTRQHLLASKCKCHSGLFHCFCGDDCCEWREENKDAVLNCLSLTKSCKVQVGDNSWDVTTMYSLSWRHLSLAKKLIQSSRLNNQMKQKKNWLSTSKICRYKRDIQREHTAVVSNKHYRN